MIKSFIVLDLNEKRIENLIIASNSIRKSKLNGLDSLSFTTTQDFLQKGYRLLYKKSTNKWYEYIITSIDEYHNGEGFEFEVYAENSFTETRGDFIEDKRSYDEPVKNTLLKILETTRWKLDTDLNFNANISFYRISAFQALSDLLKVYEIEIETKIEVLGSKVVKRTLVAKKNIGKDLGKRFSFSKDILEIKRTILEEDIITALYGFGNAKEIEGEEGSISYGRKIDFSEINDGKMYVEDVEATAKYGRLSPTGQKVPRFGKVEFETDDVAELKRKTEEALQVLSKPKISYEVSVEDLTDYGVEFEGADVGDSVIIRDKDLNLSLKARVLEISEDLKGETSTKLVLGNFMPAFGRESKELSEAVSRLVSKETVYDKAAKATAIDLSNFLVFDQVLDAINKKFSTQSTTLKFDDIRGLIATDKPEEKDSSWIAEFGSLGIRIANSRLQNGEWDWRTALTGSGVVGDSIIARTITASQLAADVGENLDLASNSAIVATVEKANALEQSLDEKTGEITKSMVDLKSELDQTAENLTLTFDKRMKDLEDLRTYFRWDSTGALIGKEGSPVVLHQSNDKIEFLEGDKVIASWERGTMSVDNLVALIQIQIGQHVVETYESTNPLVGISTIVRQV